jgi:DNA-binding transcriptional regulator of glucitol operon
VSRSYRFARSPGWVTGHLIVLAAAVAMGFLGHWQLDVSNSKHFSLQNFGYALQWWAFALFAIGMWLRILRDHARGASSVSHETQPLPQVPPPVAYRRYVMPQSSDAPKQVHDAEHAAYNAYLAGLNRAADEENR